MFGNVRCDRIDATYSGRGGGRGGWCVCSGRSGSVVCQWLDPFLVCGFELWFEHCSSIFLLLFIGTFLPNNLLFWLDSV